MKNLIILSVIYPISIISVWCFGGYITSKFIEMKKRIKELECEKESNKEMRFDTKGGGRPPIGINYNFHKKIK